MQSKENTQQTKKDLLLQAAIAVFSERGYQGATMDEIARRAGIAKGTSYLYFSDKADLFYAVFQFWAADAITASDPAVTSAGNASERLLALALSTVDYMDAHRDWIPLTLEFWAASSTPALRERFAAALSGLYAGYRGEVAAIIRAGQADGELRADADADALAALLTGAIDGLLLQCWFDPALDARKYIRGFFDALLGGIAITPKGKP